MHRDVHAHVVGGDHLQYVLVFSVCRCVGMRREASTKTTSHLGAPPHHTPDVLVFIMLSPFIYYGWRIGAPLVQMLLDGK